MWPYPKIVAHRGGGILAPENTLAAMQCGIDYGYRAVEFDVMLSKDGIPVLMHDPEFGRTVAGTGTVAEAWARDLFEMDAGSWFDSRFQHVRVPSYEAVFRFCQAHQIWMNVEIKPAPGHERDTGRVVANLTHQLLMEAGELVRPPLFSSFSLDALIAAKNAAPKIARGLLVDEFVDDWRELLATLDAIALHTNQQHLTPEWATQIKSAGYGLFCYTVNDPERGREIMRWGVDGFCTDRIDLIASDFS